MTDANPTHPEPDLLVAYGLGQLDDAEGSTVYTHLEGCAACRAVVESSPDDALTSLVRSSVRTPFAQPTAAPPGVPPVLVGHPRYRILGLLGAGGMGAVYKAQHLLMDRVVALKVLNARLVNHPSAAERFRREVRAAARLTHPNIVVAHDADQAGDAHFLVMEYVEGASLAQLVREKGPLPVAQACDCVRQAALGLQHAFEKGMVHRDIKPQNLMRTPQGVVKVLDFGLARFASETEAEAPAAPDASTVDAGVPADADTAPGTTLGTPDYMAPEQADDARAADVRADVYSLGCTLYHLLAGLPPFPDGTLVRKLKAHAFREPPPLATRRRDVPPALQRIVARMMAKDPARRYQTPADVAAALAPFASGRAARLAQGVRYILAGAVVGVVLAAAAILAVPFVFPPAGNRPAEPPGEVRRLEAPTGPVRAVAFSPDGLRAVTAGTPDRSERVLCLWDLTSGQLLRSFPGHAGAVWSVAFAPDGRRLLSGGSDGTVRLWDVDAGQELRRFEGHAGKVRSVAFARDGLWALSAGGPSPEDPRPPADAFAVRLWDVATGQEVRRFAGHTDQVRALAFSSDGRRFLSGGADGTVRLWDAVTGEQVWCFKGHREEVEGVGFAQGGRWAVSGGLDGTVRVWNAETGAARRTLEGPALPVHAVAVTPDGKRALGGAADGTVRLWDLETGKELYRFEGPAAVTGVAVSPGGGFALSAAGAEARLWRLPAD